MTEEVLDWTFALKFSVVIINELQYSLKDGITRSVEGKKENLCNNFIFSAPHKHFPSLKSLYSSFKVRNKAPCLLIKWQTGKRNPCKD